MAEHMAVHMEAEHTDLAGRVGKRGMAAAKTGETAPEEMAWAAREGMVPEMNTAAVHTAAAHTAAAHTAAAREWAA